MEHTFNYLLAWLFVGALFFNAWTAKIIATYWLNPGSIYALFWTAMSAIPLIVAFGAPINPLAIAYIALTSVAVTLSMIPFQWKNAFQKNNRKPKSVDVFGTNTLFFSALAFSTLAIFGSIGKVLAAGFSVTDLLTNTLETAGAFASSRYEGELDSTITGKIGLLSAYLAVFTGGLFAGSTNNRFKRRLTVLAAFLPAVLTATLQSAKGLLFLSIAFFYAAILIARIYDKNYILASKKDMRTLAMASLILLPVIIASFLARGLTNSGDISFILDRIYAYLVSYSSGHLYAFSDWFSYYTGDESLSKYNSIDASPGFFSILFAFRMFGDTTILPPGIFDEYFKFGDHLQSNIYTTFRGAVTDFGILGSLLAIYLIGTAANLIFLHILTTRNAPLSISLFLLAVGAIYMSYIISILTWTVIPAAIIACTVVLIFNFIKIKIF